MKLRSLQRKPSESFKSSFCTCTAHTDQSHGAKRPHFVAETFLLGGGGGPPVTDVLHQPPDLRLGVLLQLLHGLLEEKDPGDVLGVIPRLPPVSRKEGHLRGVREGVQH